ncbi:MAG: hypothetical protein OXG89_03580 [bacterium]|nr:hypothetical protein [bacterium]MCY3652093.1 hypothetical protein [bacterium]
MRFRLFGFPVHLHFSFLLILVFLFNRAFSQEATLLYTVAILISVVLHELGHAATVRRLGGRVEGITIHGLGGATYWREMGTRLDGWKLFAIAASGSGVGLFAGLGLYWYARLGGLGRFGQLAIESPWTINLRAADFYDQYLVFFVGAFIWVSVVWGLVNWLPIGGLDGSKMLRAVMIRFLGPSGDLHSRIIGMLFGIAAAYWAWQRGLVFAAVLALVFSGADLVSYRRPIIPPPVPPSGAPPRPTHPEDRAEE